MSRQTICTRTTTRALVETMWTPLLVDQETSPLVNAVHVRVTQEGEGENESTNLWMLLGYPRDVRYAHTTHESLVVHVERHGWPERLEERDAQIARWYLSHELEGDRDAHQG